jgi:hypothetical protein
VYTLRTLIKDVNVLAFQYIRMTPFQAVNFCNFFFIIPYSVCNVSHPINTMIRPGCLAAGSFLNGREGEKCV